MHRYLTMALEVNLSVALGALALELFLDGLEYLGVFEKHKEVKKFVGIALIIDFILVIGSIMLANLV